MSSSPLIIWVLAAITFIVSGMFIVLLWRLKTKHPEKYKEMGKPSLFNCDRTKTSLPLLKYLFNREYKILNDNSLSLLSDLLLIFIAIFFTLLFVMAYWVGIGA